MEESSVTSNLLGDLFIEILSRLPFSSLSRFRFVCKQWHTLITSDFLLTELYLRRGYKSTIPSIIALSQSGLRTSEKKYHLTLMDAGGGQQHDVLTTDWPHTYISPSCNGLICVYDRMNYVSLFNPVTRHQLVLPKPIVESFEAYKICFLGYLPTTKEYKVFRCIQPRSSNQINCEVYTIGTHSWRQIASPKIEWTGSSEQPIWKGGVVINGLLYCVVRTEERDEYPTGRILSFDFNSEEFAIIQLPGSLPRCFTQHDQVLELDGKLCLSSRIRFEPMELWLRKDITCHGWVHICTLRITRRLLDQQAILIHQGKILIRSRAHMFYHDMQTGEDSEVIYYNRRVLETQAHFESFLQLEEH